MDFKYLYSLTGVYDLKDPLIDWEHTIVLDKKKNKMVLLGGQLEFKFTDISDNFEKEVNTAFKQTALSQVGAVKLYKSLYDITNVIKTDVSELDTVSKKQADAIASIQEQLGDISLEELQKQINKVAENLGSTQEDVNKNLEQITNMTIALSQLEAYYSQVNSRINTNSSTIAEIQELLDGVMGDGYDNITSNYTSIKALADYVATHGEEVNGILSDISALKDASTSIGTRLDNLESADKAFNNAIYGNEDGSEEDGKLTTDSILGRIISLESDADDLKEQIEYIYTPATEDTSEGGRLVTDIKNVNDKIDGLYKVKEDGSAEGTIANAIKDAVDSVSADTSALEDRVDDICEYTKENGTITSIDGGIIKDLIDALNDLGTKKLKELNGETPETPDNGE